MTNPLTEAAEIAGHTMRFGWYYGLNRLLDRQTAQLGGSVDVRRSLPVPSRQELLTDLARLFLADARAVRDGIFPPSDDDGLALDERIGRLRRMFADLPGAVGRRQADDTASARQEAGIEDLPEYFTQDFHFQTGGYLTEDSARLYDVQVETLFYGTANAMRRAALRPLADFVHGRDQRRLSLLDVACGTGRFLRQARLAYPALRLTGVDLSRPYLDEARRHLAGLRPVELVAANAEHLPFADASQDVVVTIFLFHELPALVRRQVAAEMARVLKPGGLLIFVDSLQLGDRPGWDGLLEVFPQRFHEPYYQQYTTDDLDRLFADAGLAAVSTTPVFLSKLMVRRKE